MSRDAKILDEPHGAAATQGSSAYCLLAEQDIPVPACLAEQKSNRGGCTGCKSPHRLCLECEEPNGIADAQRGLCQRCLEAHPRPPPLGPALSRLKTFFTAKGTYPMDGSRTPVSGTARQKVDLDKVFRFLDNRIPKDDRKVIKDPIRLIGLNVVGTGQVEAREALDELRNIGFVLKLSGYDAIEIPKAAWGRTPSDGALNDRASVSATSKAVPPHAATAIVPKTSAASPPPRKELTTEEQDDALLWSAHLALKQAIGRNDTEKAVANARQVLLNAGVTRSRDQAERLVALLERSTVWERTRKKARNNDGRVTTLLMPDATETDIRTPKPSKSDPKPETNAAADDKGQKPADIPDAILDAAMRTLEIAGSGNPEIASPIDWLRADGSDGHDPVAILDALERNGRLTRDPNDKHWDKALLPSPAPPKGCAEDPKKEPENDPGTPPGASEAEPASPSLPTRGVPERRPAAGFDASDKSTSGAQTPPRRLGELHFDRRPGESNGEAAARAIFGEGPVPTDSGRKRVNPSSILDALHEHAVEGVVRDPTRILMDRFGFETAKQAERRLQYARDMRLIEGDGSWTSVRLLRNRDEPERCPANGRIDPKPQKANGLSASSAASEKPAGDAIETAWNILSANADDAGRVEKPIPLLMEKLGCVGLTANRYLNALLDARRIEKPGKRFDRIRLRASFATKPAAPEPAPTPGPAANTRPDRLKRHWAELKKGFRGANVIKNPLAFLRMARGIPQEAAAAILWALADAGYIDPRDAPGWEEARYPRPTPEHVERVLFEAIRPEDGLIEDPIATIMDRFGLKNSQAAGHIETAKSAGTIELVALDDEIYLWTKKPARHPETAAPPTKPAMPAHAEAPAMEEIPPTKPPTAQTSAAERTSLSALTDPGFRRDPNTLRHLAALADARGDEGAALASALRREADIREQAETRIGLATKVTDAELALILP